VSQTLIKLGVWNQALIAIGETTFIDDEAEDSLAAEICRMVYDDLLREVLEARAWPFAVGSASLVSVDEETDTFDDVGVSSFDLSFAVIDTQQVAVELDGSALTPVTDYVLTPSSIGQQANVTLTSALTSGQTLTVTKTNARNGWGYLYALPADCVKALALLYEDELRLSTPTRIPFDVIPDDAGVGFYIATNSNDFEVLEYVRLMENVISWPRQFLNAMVFRLAVPLASGLRKDPKLALTMTQLYSQAVNASFAHQAIARSTPSPETPSLIARR